MERSRLRIIIKILSKFINLYSFLFQKIEFDIIKKIKNLQPFMISIFFFPNKRHSFLFFCNYLICPLSNFLDTAKESWYWTLLPSMALSAHPYPFHFSPTGGQKVRSKMASIYFKTSTNIGFFNSNTRCAFRATL